MSMYYMFPLKWRSKEGIRELSEIMEMVGVLIG